MGDQINMGEEELLHTQHITTKYIDVETEIRRALNELLLLSRIGSDDYSSRGLIFTEDFSIRELTEDENPKYKSNPATIKRETLFKTTEEVKNYLLDLLENDIDDEKIREKYKTGIQKFFSTYLPREKIKTLYKMVSEKGDSSLFHKYLIQINEIPYEGEKSIGIKNISQQLAKILFNKFGDEAFISKERTTTQPPSGRNNYIKANNTHITYRNDFTPGNPYTIEGNPYTIEGNPHTAEGNDYTTGGNSCYVTNGNIKYSIERIYLSEKSLDYISRIFSIANKVRESWGYSIGQVFHDEDFLFIQKNRRVDETMYIKVLLYLLNHNKQNFFGKRGEAGQAKRTKKTTQYADILRALTNNQLGIDNLNTTEFERDDITKTLYENGKDLLKRIISETNNEFILETNNESTLKTNNKFIRNGRLKKIESCAQKIIEGKNKKMRDIIGFRVSLRGVRDINYESIKKISLKFLEGITNPTTYNSSFQEIKPEYIQDINSRDTDITIPHTYVAEQTNYCSFSNNTGNYTNPYDTNNQFINTQEGQTITIKNIRIDNKGVLNNQQVEELCNIFNDIAPTTIRKKTESPYTDYETWKTRMKEYHSDIVNDPEQRPILKNLFQRFTTGIERGSNGDYKDFKFNITFEIKNKDNEIIGERAMEIQFDDIRNLMGLAGHHIRDSERSTNTLSRLSFSVPLDTVRKACEKALKRQREELDEFCSTNGIIGDLRDLILNIKFDEDLTINIDDYYDRDPNNNEELNKGIIEMINYYLEKGTFILCTDANTDTQKHIFKKSKLTIEDLENTELLNHLEICTVRELASQQHSCLHKNLDVQLGVYIEKQNRIGWISLKKLILYMDLGIK